MALPTTKTNDHTNSVNTAAKVFTEHGDFIRTVIRYQVRNESQTDDLFQDFFLSLVSRPIPAGIQNIKSYLYKAITNDIIDATRRVEKYQDHVREYTVCLGHSVGKKTLEDAFAEVDEVNKIFRLIEKRLQRCEAQAITLSYRNNHRIKEIAEKMNVSNGAIRGYISKGFRKIRQFLTNSMGGY